MGARDHVMLMGAWRGMFARVGATMSNAGSNDSFLGWFSALNGI
ncbi:hypothetical protein APED_31950 [Acanthopleuribacter pedis]